jgi:hypothetical protein
MGNSSQIHEPDVERNCQTSNVRKIPMKLWYKLSLHFGRIFCLLLQGDRFWIRCTPVEKVLLGYGVMRS